MNDVKTLKEAVEKLHNCKAVHCNSVRVKETFKGQVVWDGMVEVFNLTDSKPAKRCYAWQHTEDSADTRTRVVTVLEVPPVSSPETAVRAAIVERYKANKAN